MSARQRGELTGLGCRAQFAQRPEGVLGHEAIRILQQKPEVPPSPSPKPVPPYPVFKLVPVGGTFVAAGGFKIDSDRSSATLDMAEVERPVTETKEVEFWAEWTVR